jgi:hypothetical protein
VENERVLVCRVFAAANTRLQARLSFDATQWTPATAIQLDIESPQGGKLLSQKFGQAESNGPSVEVQAPSKGFYSIFVVSTNTPARNKAPLYKVTVGYTAPQVM